MKDGVRILNVARGPLVVDEDLKAALDSGKVAGAALDVFRAEPITDHPLFGYPNVIVTPHLGASTAEATDRAGYQAAEQVRGRAHRRRRDERGQRARGRRRGRRGARAVPRPGAAAWAGSPWRWPRAPRSTASRSSTWARRRARHPPPHRPGAQGRPRRPHRGGGQRRERARAGRGARHRGGRDHAVQRARLHRPRARDRGQRQRAHAGGGHGARPPRPAAPARGVGLALQRPARATTWRSSATATSRECSAAWASRWARRA